MKYLQAAASVAKFLRLDDSMARCWLARWLAGMAQAKASHLSISKEENQRKIRGNSKDNQRKISGVSEENQRKLVGKVLEQLRPFLGHLHDNLNLK